MNIINKTVQPIVGACKTLVRSSAESINVAERAANIYGVGKVRKALMSSKAAINGAGKPILEKMEESSFSFGVLSKTLKRLKRRGIKKSKGELKEAVKELGGVNDVNAAIKAEGATGGIKEIAKTATRLISSSGLFVAGLFSPIPGGSAIGWVLGEKFTEKCFGKPFTKQIKHIKQILK